METSAVLKGIYSQRWEIFHGDVLADPPKYKGLGSLETWALKYDLDSDIGPEK